MKPQHPSSTPGGRGPSSGAPHPRGNPQHLEYRPKGAQQQQQQHDGPAHPQMPPPGADGMDVNAPVFKQGGGFNLQHTARPYNGPMGYAPAPPMGGQPGPGMPQQMRGPHHHHQPRPRGPPRGAMHHQQQQQQQQQQYMPRGAMNASAQGYYPPQMQMPPPYMMGPGQYMGGPPMYGMPPMQDMGMGMGGMPMPMPAPQPQHQPPPKRERKRLEIIDPKTGKAIVLGRGSSSGRASDASSTSAAEDAKAAVSSTSTTAQSTPQKKESTPPKEAPAAPAAPAALPAAGPPAPEAPQTDVKQNGSAKTVTKSPKKSPKKKPATEKPAPVAEPAKDVTPAAATTATNGAKETKEGNAAKSAAFKEFKDKVEKVAAKTPVEKTVEKKSETSKTGSSTTTTTITTTTTTSTDVSSPKSTKKTTVKEAKETTEETAPVKQSKAISPKKTAPVQDAAPTALQQKAVVVEKEDKVHADVTEEPTTTTVEKTTDVSVTLQKKSDGKVTYTLELMMSFREQYKELPAAAAGPDSKWPSMEITSEVAVSRGGSRGGRNGAGWERGEKQAGGGSGRGSRGSSGGGGQWARSQDLPKRSGGGRGERGGGRGGRGGRGGPPDPPLLDGPVKPLTRSDNRWIPTKNASTLEVTKKNVNGIMNKMTREKFDRLAGQLTAINMESLEMLQTVIKIIFDKAVGEPNFCDMYADLCVHLETNWKVWSFLKIVQNDDDKMFYWTAMSDSDSEVVGPFEDVSSALESASGDEFEPVPAPSNMKLSEVRVRDHKFIKVWVEGDAKEPRYYWSGQDLDDLGDDQVLNGPYDSHDTASRFAIKTCSFKRILLNACQEEFEKDNIYEELEKSFKKDKEEGKITPQMEADYEEKRMIMKLRMLGNIRFIGELYRKGMLQERIMHECIMKLMDVRLNSDGMCVCVHPSNPPDEESIESLVKLLTTMGKDLDKHGAQGFMPSYFHYLENKLVKNKRLSSRITFMIKDVIELRQHRWEPRRKELKQKTLNEIRKEAEREARAPPSSGPSGGGRDRDRDRGDRDHFRSDRRSNSSRDGFNSGRSTMAPVYQHSQSMNNRGSSSSNNNRQMTLPRGIGARDDSVKTGPSGRPAAFGFSSRQQPPGRGGPSGSPASFPSSRRGPTPGAKKPQSPAPRAKVIPPLDDEAQEKIGKKAKSIAEEYVLILDLKEAETCLVELQKEFKNHEDVNRVFAFEVLKEAIDAKAEAREKMMEVLDKLSLETKTLTFVGIRYAIEKTIELCGDLWCDVPKLHEHLSEFVVRFMKHDSTVTGISVDWVMGSCLQSVDKVAMEELVDGGFLAAFLGEILKLLKAADVEKATKEISATNVTVLSLFPSYKQSPEDMQEWVQKHDIEDVLPLKPAFGLVERVSKASSYDEVVSFIEDNIPQAMRNDPLFATYACLFILSLSKEGELPSAERCMLLTGFCGNTDTQVRLISAIMQTRTDNDEVKKLLKHLVKEGAVLAPAFSKWLELKNDNSVSRKRAQEELGEFVEELARTK
ncbi:a1-alpha2 repression [Phytophthora pseudosyringae]|uniref:A1-alpha2 repression n=1 Tax=Phytophthora pseudosyringae TaxID=221518 RepID=A0A8T1WCJ2_9STRA|nr:a1-alpha2 repression [Phytophthora pseudosyringae]